MTQRRLLSIILPTWNEIDGIGPTLDAIPRDVLDAQGWDLEIIVVDAESTDGTQEAASARGANVIIESRRGYGRAYKTGFAAAAGDVIVTGDADASYPFERLADFLAAKEQGGYHFVTCDRYAEMGPGAMGAKHRLGNGILSLTTRILYGLRLRDSQSGMWLIDRRVLDTIDMDALSDGMAFSEGIKIEAFRAPGIASAEIDGALRAREGEVKLRSWRDGFHNLWALVRRRFTGRWT